MNADKTLSIFDRQIGQLGLTGLERMICLAQSAQVATCPQFRMITERDGSQASL
jgi:hypothetical protein